MSRIGIVLGLVVLVLVCIWMPGKSHALGGGRDFGTFSGFTPGGSTDQPAIGFFVPDRNITLTRVDWSLGTLPANCTDNPSMEVDTAAAGVGFAIPAQSTTDIPFAAGVAVAAGTPITIAYHAGLSCSTYAGNFFVTVEYHTPE